MFWGAGRVLLIGAAMVLAGIALHRLAVRWHPAADSYPIQGVDVSEADGAVDWGVVAGGGATFAYAQATDGANVRDARFEENWRGIAAAKLQRGAVLHYSFCQPAIDQADAFNTMVPRDAAALPPVIAIDYAGACTTRPERRIVVTQLQLLIARVESHMGKQALLKLTRAVDGDYRLSEALQRNVWVVGNAFPPSYAARPWRLWQATDYHRVEGVEEPMRWSVVAK